MVRRKGTDPDSGLIYYMVSFAEYLKGKGVHGYEIDTTYIGMVRSYPEHFVVWRASRVLAGHIDPVEDMDGYPLSSLRVEEGGWM
jgi:hypothetical protein